MKLNRMSSIARYVNEDIDLTITAIIIYIDFIDFRSLPTLKTLNVLKIFTVLKALTAPPPLPLRIVISKTESITTLPSRKFIFSQQYPTGPVVHNLNTISTMKIQVNAKFISVYIASSSAGRPYLSIARTTVLIVTQRVIRLSKIEFSTKLQVNALNFLHHP
jgi:hypothetical protein